MLYENLLKLHNSPGFKTLPSVGDTNKQMLRHGTVNNDLTIGSKSAFARDLD